MLIGLEIELHSSSRHDIYSIAEAEGLNFETFVMKDGLNVKMSVEYYTRTIEYNFEPKQFTKLYLAKVKKFIKAQMKKYNLKVCTKGPGFVGMHVHIFDLKYRKLKGNQLLCTAMDEIDKDFDSFDRFSKQRLGLSHQLWGNYVHNNFYDYHQITDECGLHMAYPGLSNNREKYNPYIISRRSNKGKPRSVELRILPNEFLFNDGLYRMLKRISIGDYAELSINDLLEDWVRRI